MPEALRRAAHARLTPRSLAEGVAELSRRDADLARVVERHGMPQLWSREPGFAALVRFILEQQVSLASARAVFERLTLAAGEPLSPSSFLALGEEGLRAAGFTRQKAEYCRGLALMIERGEIDIARIDRMSDKEAKAALLRIRGVGPWTADVYLLMALGRTDAWPAGDLALAVAAHEVKRLDARPSAGELEHLAEGWRPFRAVAAHILWHHYLNRNRAGERRVNVKGK